MKKSKVLIFRNRVIKHMREKKYNINQPTRGKNTFTVFSPEGIEFVILFKKKNLIIASSFELIKKSRTTVLEFVNELNSKSFRMKFSITKENILIIETRVQNIYQKKEFQNVLIDIDYDLDELFIGTEQLGEMLK